MKPPKNKPTRAPFPPWLKKRVPTSENIHDVRRLLNNLRLATVCQSAHCPNQCECFARGTATFMLLGDICTRRCRFCAVTKGICAPPDPDEPERVAQAAAYLKLEHVVVTSVTRDDLSDGGAEQFHRTILALREKLTCRIEVLTPDFQGDHAAIDRVASAKPDVYNHNVETVPHLYSTVRPQANYQRSIDLLRTVKDAHPTITTKSGVMVGLGETDEEVFPVMRVLREARCDLITIGQYLQPTPDHLPVQKYITPEQFADYEAAAKSLGFKGIAAGPFVRSSYNAKEMLEFSKTPAKHQQD